MDTTKEYIQMCVEARELLSVPRFKSKGQPGDFVYDTIRGVQIIAAVDVGEGGIGYLVYKQYEDGYTSTWFDSGDKTKVWLPRVDQLIDMIQSFKKDISTAFFMNIASNSSYRGITVNGDDTIEKHLLVFYMVEQQNLTWSVNKWVVYDRKRNGNRPRQLFNELKGYIASKASISEVKPESIFKLLEFDTVDMLELADYCEKRFNVNILEHEMNNCITIQDFIEVLRNKMLGNDKDAI